MRAVIGSVSLALLFAAPACPAEDEVWTVVGRVANTSSKLAARKIFVQAGERKWALHLGSTSRIFHAGEQVSIHQVDLGMWVHARGRRIGKLRLEVMRLDVAGDRAAYRKSQAYGAAEPDGYAVPGFVN